jgi:hypothetical protein
MSNTIDLDILFEKIEKEIKLKSKDGQEFTLKLHISPNTALKVIKSHKDGKNEIDQAAEIAQCLLEEQYEKEFEIEWIKKNIRFEFLMYLAKSVDKYVRSSTDIIAESNNENSGATKKK